MCAPRIAVQTMTCCFTMMSARTGILQLYVQLTLVDDTQRQHNCGQEHDLPRCACLTPRRRLRVHPSLLPMTHRPTRHRNADRGLAIHFDFEIVTLQRLDRDLHRAKCTSLCTRFAGVLRARGPTSRSEKHDGTQITSPNTMSHMHTTWWGRGAAWTRLFSRR